MAAIQDPLPIAFSEWPDRGYQTSPVIEDPPEPCIICGAVMNTCTTHIPQPINNTEQEGR